MAGFKKATREKIWLKVLLAGASGSGKTYSALRLASGVAKKDNGKIAAIDTENGRIRYYANEFDFDDLQLEMPYSPEKYIEAIDIAINEGYHILIVDSITHEWDYCLEIHSKMPGNSYTNWAKITPRHDAFMEKILQSPLHVFATVRGKDEYVMEEKNGKQVPKKVGLGYKQRDNTEYNYTVTFNIDQKSHVAESMKDNTHIFEDRYDVLTEKDGGLLYDWANSGDTPAPKPIEKTKEMTETIVEDIKDINKKIANLAKEKSSVGENVKSKVKEVLAKYHPSGNPNKIADIEESKKCLEEINNINMEDNINE